MTVETVVADPRLVARIVNLATRCGCGYRSLEARVEAGATRMRFEFEGTADALRLLDAQIAKLVAVDRQTVNAP